MQRHSGSHVFMFQCNVNSVVVMQYKDYHSSINPLCGRDDGGGMQVFASFFVGTL